MFHFRYLIYQRGDMIYQNLITRSVIIIVIIIIIIIIIIIFSLERCYQMVKF